MDREIKKIGIFVSAVCHDGEGNFLMAKRGGQARDKHGEWEFGGGSVEYGETLEGALKREMHEEFGSEPFNIKQVEVREFMREDSHWIGIFFVAQIDRGTVYIAEPVYDEIGWFTLSTLPSPMMEGDEGKIGFYVENF